MEFEFMTADTVVPPCMPLPTAMLRLPISSTAKVMYARLLNTTLTAGIEDSNGILFVRFPIMELAAALSRSPVTVKRSLKELEDIGLILRVRRGRKNTGTPGEAAYPEGTDAPALYQRSYAGKFPFKAGSADRRGCDGHSETGIFPNWHKRSCCRKRERSGSRGTPYGVRAQLYTGQAGALRPAGGFLRKADDFQHICGCFQSSQGTLHFPCAGCASYSFVDLPPGNTLCYKLFPADKFYNFMTSKMESILDILRGCAILKTRKVNFPSGRRLA